MTRSLLASRIRPSPQRLAAQRLDFDRDHDERPYEVWQERLEEPLQPEPPPWVPPEISIYSMPGRIYTWSTPLVWMPETTVAEAVGDSQRLFQRTRRRVAEITIWPTIEYGLVGLIEYTTLQGDVCESHVSTALTDRFCIRHSINTKSLRQKSFPSPTRLRDGSFWYVNVSDEGVQFYDGSKGEKQDE